jgi:2-polyprenyl-3-methyl-5-hydroxy-6-metoxy-1,4-benzoquinol methylase
VTYGAAFFAGRSETVVRSAAGVVPVLRDLLDPRSLLDVGCGQGEWLEAFGLEDSVGVDIAYTDQLEMWPLADYSRHDLQYALDLERTFDLVVCLEVAEHLPPAAADVLVDTLCRHSGTVVFSAAVPGQEGIGHINCQPHEYWHAKFAARGYAVNDAIRPRIAGDWTVSPWYRDNIFLYLRRRSSTVDDG